MRGHRIVKVSLSAVLVVLAVWSIGFRSNGRVSQQGINFAGWSTDAFSTPAASSSLQALAATGATWVSVVVEQYQDTVDSTRIFRTKQTVADSGLVSIINQAHALRLNVSLKPQIDVLTGSFRGNIGKNFTRSQWTAWFASYHEFIVHYSSLAQRTGVQQLVVGTELTRASRHAAQWRSIVRSVRAKFSGTLTYAANFRREIIGITWWNALNFIGVDAYYPLNPSKPDFGWAPYISRLSVLSKRWNKPILLTEIGYRSVVGAMSEPWNSNLVGSVDTSVQSRAYAAAFQAFENEPWFAGMYWWDWSPQIPNGPTDSGYSPQNKPAEREIAKWFGGSR